MIKKNVRSLFLAICILLLTGLGYGQTQVWEKLVAPGLTYRMEVDLGLPRMIHAFRYSPGAFKTTSSVELGNQVVFDRESETNGRQILTGTIKQSQAIAGVNADFFPWTGDPIGAMVRMKELISTPYPNRPVFAWGPGLAKSAVLAFSGTISQDDNSVVISGVNEACKADSAVLSTTTAGWATAETNALHMVIATDTMLTPTCQISGKVKLFVPDSKEHKIEPGTMVITATGIMADKLRRFRLSDATIRVETKDLDWNKAYNVVGGSNQLVRNGLVSLEAEKAGVAQAFVSDLHPRTAIGSTKQGDIWVVVVDGRQSMSRGCGLDEMAKIMQRLGCFDAINLDGGGSSTLAVAGQVLNRPSGGTERAISNCILFFSGEDVKEDQSVYVIKGRPRVTAGELAQYSLVMADGSLVPNSQVLWSAQGSAWIDQGGLLRAEKEGNCILQAWVRGSIVKVDVIVEKKPEQQNLPPPKKTA